jgi:HD-GYP domain-containing protein (c-di-GMP phosphodiesterase class II)
MLISDLKMPGLDGLQLLEEIERESLDVLSVIMTGFGTVETAIEAMKRGAHDYILKPFKIEEVIHVVQKGLEFQRLRAENIRLRTAVTLYEVSQTIATSLDVNLVLDVILQAVLREVGADAVTLHRCGESGSRVEQLCTAFPQVNGIVRARDLPDLSFGEIVGAIERKEAVLANGARTAKYVRGKSEAMTSFASVPLMNGNRLCGLLSAYSYRAGKAFDEGARKLMSILASRAAASLETARLYDDLLARNADLTKVNTALEENFRQTIVGFARALEESDRYTRGHSERVAVYSKVIAQGMSLSDSEVEMVRQSGLMHDIGKIGINTEMLNKPGKLTPEEVAIFQEHPDMGKRILEPIPFMKDLIPGVWCHHEHIDGRGYPQGLTGLDIPMLGRVIGIADAYDAMTSDRAYRRALSHAAAVAEIKRCSGSQFDPELAKIFLERIEIWRQRQQDLGEPYPE